jgi:hypothetical protein
LFDLVADPNQKKNVAKKYPQIQNQLADAVRKWRDDVLPKEGKDDRPFPVGHADQRTTFLPARDGQPHGGIERSNRYPNSSYFTHWTSTEDSITWNIEVLTPGSYAVEVFYTCPPADVGSEIELSLNGSTAGGKVTEPHDPPVLGGEHDRIPRKESYVKDFRPLKLGTIELKQGRGELTLRAIHIPGSQEMDFRLLTLTRVGG